MLNLRPYMLLFSLLEIIHRLLPRHSIVLNTSTGLKLLKRSCDAWLALRHMSLCHVLRVKSPLAPNGFSTSNGIPGVDFWNTYAPVAHIESIHTISGLAATLN
ncbi:hypothetical protein Moror_3732 [Moniliophthora roreri MCA 2997]|uniref:Uncharacterized protein n=1 Tax=Moniliophthora roreri (strain MCA 2997) TaxID=1381753 RepID=V2W3I4_MONRO|nr:hypothetical protein Moror_3732 [Moniliophthora roreri MCA 2997]